jgi:hypothetical protein
MLAESFPADLMIRIMGDDDLVVEVILESRVKMLYVIGFYKYTLTCDK